MRTYVYVDGFNLYYGALKDTPYKWLNIHKLCNFLLPNHNLARIKYFTARISARPNDPGQPTRQQIYLRALRTLPDFEIIYGSFLTTERFMPLADQPFNKQKFVKVIRTEEKGSDVNIATHLLSDGFGKRYAAAVLVTNDSDLLEPIKVVRNEIGCDVGLVNPHKYPSKVLAPHMSFIKQIRKGALAASQFPDELKDRNGIFHKPTAW